MTLRWWLWCSACKVAEHELTKHDQISDESLADYVTVLANLARKAFLDGVGEERKQLLRQLEDGLSDPASSSLYLDYYSAHPESSITNVLSYLQEHEVMWKRKGQGENLTLRQENPTVNRLMARMESM